MRLPDWLAARIRTAWPMLLGYLAAWLLVLGAPVAGWIERTLGITVTEPQAAAAIGVLLGYLIYEVGRWLEARRGGGRLARLARGLGHLLIAVGFATGQPRYGPLTVGELAVGVSDQRRPAPRIVPPPRF